MLLYPPPGSSYHRKCSWLQFWVRVVGEGGEGESFGSGGFGSGGWGWSEWSGACVGGSGKLPTNDFFAARQQQRDLTLSLATHLLRKLSFEEWLQPESSRLKWTFGVEGFEQKIWEEISKVYVHWSLSHHTSSLPSVLIKKGAFMRRQKDIVRRSFSPLPVLLLLLYMASYFFPKGWQLFGQNQPLHLLANAKMQHGSLWWKIGFNLASACLKYYLYSNISACLKYYISSNISACLKYS